MWLKWNMFYFLSPFPFINLTIPSTGWRFELSCVICMYKFFGWLYHDSPEYNVRKMWSSFFHLFRVGREWTSSKKMFSTGSFFSLPSHLAEGSWLLDLNGCLKGQDWTILTSETAIKILFLLVTIVFCQTLFGSHMKVHGNVLVRTYTWLEWTELKINIWFRCCQC